MCKSLAWDTIVKEVNLAGRSTPEPLKGTLGVCGVGLGPQLSDGALLNTWCVAKEQSFWEGIKGRPMRQRRAEMVASQLGLAPGGCSRHLEGIPAQMRAIVPQHMTLQSLGSPPELLRGDCCSAFPCSLPNTDLPVKGLLWL